MALSDELRESRLKRLHDRFLEAADRWSSLYHVAVHPLQSVGWRWLRPSWAVEAEGDNEQIKTHQFESHPQSREDHKSEQYQEYYRSVRNYQMKHEALWEFIVKTAMANHYGQHSRDYRIESHIVCWDFKGQPFAGRFLNPVLDDHSERTRDDIRHFKKLADEAMCEFAMDDYPIPQSDSWGGGLSYPWLETIYSIDEWAPVEIELSPEPSTSLHGSPDRFDFSGLGCRFWVASSTTNVFLDSARTIEFLNENEADLSPARSPAEWEKVFDCSWDTLKRRMKSGELHFVKIHSKSYKLPLDEVPRE